MSGVFEPAASGRAKCRACAGRIERGELRFGERLANPFAEGEMTLWFHPLCAGYKRPEPLLEALAQTSESLPGRENLERVARQSSQHRRLPRIDGAERAASGQAKCRSCRAAIERGTWRIRLVYYEEGRFTPGGFVHLACRATHFESDAAASNAVRDAVLHFSAGLGAAEREELARALDAPTGPA